MKNIPIFTSRGGTATLILSEIPHSGRAYILLHTFLPKRLLELIGDCQDACTQLGAKELFIASDGNAAGFRLPVAYDILIYTRPAEGLPEPEHAVWLVPVDASNESTYIRVYNSCFSAVSHAVTYDHRQMERVYREGQQAFLYLHPDGTPAGIGEVHGCELAAVGILPEFRGGHGRDLTLELLNRCTAGTLLVTVSSDNAAALGLYQALGFHLDRIESRWYRLS